MKLSQWTDDSEKNTLWCVYIDGGAAGEMKTLLLSGCVLKQQSDAEFESSLCCSEGGHPDPQLCSPKQ